MNVGLVLVTALHVGAVLSLKSIYFRVREVSNGTFERGVEPRVYAGFVARESQFPFMVYVMMRQTMGFSLCSASLVRPSWVLLAAHCFPSQPRPENVLAIGGRADLLDYVEWQQLDCDEPVDEKAFGLQERRGKKIYLHPKYHRETYRHDLALIEVKEPFVLGSVKTIPISEEKMKKKKVCLILGWGLELGNSQKFRLNFVENKQVSTTEIGCFLNRKKDPFICLEPDGRGICQGDSGSPLVCDGKVWGVASHLISYKEEGECGDSVEEYYTEIYDNLDWLRSVYGGAPSGGAISVRTLLLCAFAGLWMAVKI